MKTLAIIAAAVIAWFVCWVTIALNSKTRAVGKAVKPTFVPEAEAGTVPRPGSRRWARSLFFNKMITMEELVSFCASHPEDLSDADR